MDRDSCIGLIIIIGGLFFMTSLVWWSKRTIDRIAKKRLRSSREILKDLHHDR